MVYFLRDSKRKNYFEVEFWNGKDGFDLSAHVYTLNCCKYLFKNRDNIELIGKWLGCLEFLEEFRGWFWEIYVQQENSYKSFDEDKARTDIKNKLIEIAKILELHIVED